VIYSIIQTAGYVSLRMKENINLNPK